MPQPSNPSGLRFICGIICKSKVLRFERMLFRATRGNMLFNQAPAGEQIMDPVSTEMVLFLLIIFKKIDNWTLFFPFSICIYHFIYRVPSLYIFPLMSVLSMTVL